MIRARPLALFAAVALAGLACTTAHRSRSPAESLLAASKDADDEFPSASAVALLRSQKVGYFYGHGESWTTLEDHEAWLVRNEAGKALANVRIPIVGKARLVELKARTHSPDGTIVELTQDQLVEEKAQADDEDDAFSIRVFRFPNVQVGSVLEFTYVLQFPWIVQALDEQVAPDMPVHHYELEMKIPDRILFEFVGYNIPTEVTREKAVDFTRVTLALDHVDRAPTEWSGPHWTVNRPWWNFRVRRFRYGNWVSDPMGTWAQNLAALEKQLDSDPKLFAGFDAKLPPDDCSGQDEDKRCRIRTALHWLHEQTRPSKFGTWDNVRPMKEVLEGVTASGWEQAVLLRRVLVDAGVQADLAPTTRVLSRQVDAAYPDLDQLNHALVYVPSQDGLTRPLWIDPICVHCALGQIPEWVYGAAAVPLPKDPAAQVTWLRVTGVQTHRAEQRHAFAVDVDVAGDAEIAFDDNDSGDKVLFEATRQRKLRPEERKDELERALRDRASSAKLVSFELDRCDETKAKCEQSSKFKVANFATLDGTRLLIPLSIFSGFEQETLSADRETDVHLDHDFLEDETIRVSLPEGYRVESLPSAMKKAIPGLSVSIAFGKTSDGFLVHRQLEWKRAVHPVTEWKELREVLQAYQNARTSLITATHESAPTAPTAPPSSP